MPERTEFAHGTPSWVDLATTDVTGAETFYGGILGWKAERMPAGEGIYSMQRVRGIDAAGIYEQNEDQKAGGMPPSWTTYITVDDIDDHVPHTHGDTTWGHRGRAFAIGYIQGMIEAVAKGG